MKNRNRIYPLILAGFFLILATGCKKENNNSGNLTNGTSTAVFKSGVTYGTMTDQEGNFYRTVKIGNQTWLAENLRTTIYRNGVPIEQGTNNYAWSQFKSGAYCNFNNTKNKDSINTFGRLYNWYAVSNSLNLAPAGWHVPSSNEWITLFNYLGGVSQAGGKLKEADNLHWNVRTTGNIADNSSGFTALPGNILDCYGNFSRNNDNSDARFGDSGFWWSSSEYDTFYAWNCYMNYNYNDVFPTNSIKNSGLSVRCIKD